MVADRSVTVRLRANVRDFNRDIGTSSAAVATLESRLRSADKEGGASIDRLSGRLRVIADLLAILGPAAAPIGAVAVPAVAGLAAQLGFASTGALGFIVAVQGIGDGLEALNKAHLEPTAENLAAARIAMERLSPAGQDLTRQLFGLRDEWRELRDVSQEALFPGLSEALDDFETRLPDVERLLVNVNTAVGEMLADGAESLASPRWDDFFTFIATDAPPALSAMGAALGNVAHAMSELWMAFDPLNDSFATWLVDSTARLDEWAQGLSRTQGFQEFVDYIRENGPQVAETLGAVALAVLDIVEAAAPLGGPVLAALEAVAKAISAIANSDAGPAIMATVTALALLRRGMAAMESVQGTTWAKGVKGADTFAGKVAAARTPLLRTSAALAGLAIASSDTAQGFGLANTASGAMLGMIGGPWGAAVGGAVGLMLDLTEATGGFTVNVDELTGTLDQQTGAITANTRAYAANELEKQGVLKAAQDLGLSLSDVTRASLGDAEALARVNAQLEVTRSGMFDTNGHLKVGTDQFLDFGNASGLVTDAIGVMSGELTTGQGRVRRMADATDEGADALTRAESAAQDFANAVTRLNDILAGRAALRDYQAALDDFAASIKENGRSFDITTEKGRANQAALDTIASTAIRVAENMKGAARQRVLTAAIQDLREIGGKFDVPKSETQALIRLLQKANNTNVNPSIDANISPAEAKIRALEARLRAIRDEDVFINVRQIGSTTLGPRPGVADGGTIPGPRMPYGDKMLYALAPGEEVISNRHGQADRHRPLLKAINGGLAGGGTAGKWGGPQGGRPGSRGLDKPEDLLDSLNVPLTVMITRFGSLGRAIHQSEKALERETGQRDKAQSALDATSEAMNNLAAATTSGFRTSLFQTEPGDSNIWAPGARGSKGGLFENLTTDITGLQKRGELQSALALAGLDGAALQAALSEGNNDDLQKLLDSGRVQDFENMFNQREALLASVGGQAGQLVHGSVYQAQSDELARQTAELQGVKQELRELRQEERQREREREARADARADRQADRTGDKVNGAVAPASRNNPRPKVGRL